MNHENKSAAEIKERGKHLAWLLRHGANESGLAMTTAGFAKVDDVLRIARISRGVLDRVIEENNKSRYELSADGVSVRACQGHSLSGTPVTREGLEATWQIVVEDALIFHGTAVAAARSILAEGMEPMARTHVHLAESETAKVGKRASVDVLLAVSPRKLRALGFAIFRAPNGVLLARRVPASAIVDVTGQTRAGENAVAELRALVARVP